MSDILYGVRLVRVRALNEDLTINEAGAWTTIQTAQEVATEPQYKEGQETKLEGGDDVVAIVKEPDVLSAISLTFRDAKMNPEGAAIIGGGTVLRTGYSRAQNAIDPATTAIVVDATHKALKLAVNGAAAVEFEVASGSYATWNALLDAINAGIAASDLNELVTATYVPNQYGTGGRVKFVSADKTASASVAWTAAAADDLGALLGRGAPVEENVITGYQAPLGDEVPVPFELEVYVAKYSEEENAQVLGFIKWNFYLVRGRVPGFTAANNQFATPQMTMRAEENVAAAKPVVEWDEVAELPAA